MRFSIAIIFLIIFVVLSGQAWSRVLATVGQENITTEDINKIKQQLKTDNPSFAASISSDEILNQLIDIKVGLMDARLAGMDQLREAKDAMDAALFNYYRAVKVDNIYKNKKFSKKEIVDYYNANPMVKFQRLSIPFSPGNANSAKEALAKISVVRGDIAAKRLTFDQAIEKFGYKNSSATSGTFDRIPLPSLENSEASELKDLSIDEVSPVITGNDFVSIVKLIKIYPMSSENYEPINERLKMEAATKARIDYFKSLRQKYSGFVIIQK